MLQIRIVLDSFFLILDDLQYVRLDLRIITVNLLLHDVVAVRIPELIDYRNFLVGFHFRGYFCTVNDNPRMENLLVYLFPEVVSHAAHECSLRKISDFGSRYQGIQLRIDGGGCILSVDGNGLPLLEYLAETLRQVLGRFPDHLHPSLLQKHHFL